MEQARGFGRRFRGGLRAQRGPGRGMGYGRGYGSMWYPADETAGISDKTLIENEIRVLKDQISFLEEKLSETKEK
jgi:hypothetical protein